MTDTESDEAFLNDMEQWVIGSLVFKKEHRQRIFALARRGAEVERLRAALQKIGEGDTPRPVAKPFRADGVASKNDRCEHGQWMYEDCGQCIEQFARAALEDRG